MAVQAGVPRPSIAGPTLVTLRQFWSVKYNV
jgi:hypothetical protein